MVLFAKRDTGWWDGCILTKGHCTVLHALPRYVKILIGEHTAMRDLIRTVFLLWS